MNEPNDQAPANDNGGDEPTELPSTEDLADELHQLEDKAVDPPTETAPDPAPDAPDPPADGTEAPPDETPATEPDPPDSPQDDPGDAQDAQEVDPDRKGANQTRSAQSEKKTADATRRKAAIEAAPKLPDPSEADLKEQARKDEIRAQMQLVQTELDETLDAAEACRNELKDLSAQLYPHLVESDHHVDAVRGYVASQKKIRAMRASSPEQIKRILEAAGKAPIDAAFQRQRARGMKRPARTQVQAKPTGGDAAPGADKPDADAA
jgi:hypothetical protein